MTLEGSGGFHQSHEESNSCHLQRFVRCYWVNTGGEKRLERDLNLRRVESHIYFLNERKMKRMYWMHAYSVYA